MPEPGHIAPSLVLRRVLFRWLFGDNDLVSVHAHRRAMAALKGVR